MGQIIFIAVVCLIFGLSGNVAALVVGILFAIPAIILIISTVGVNNEVDKYDPNKVNTSRMMQDKLENHLTDAQVRRNMISGKYDWKTGDYDITTGEYRK